MLELEEYDPGQPGPGEALIRQTAVGLNFIDTYFRTGLYPPAGGLPFTPGNEGAGVVEAVGDGVTEVQARPARRLRHRLRRLRRPPHGPRQDAGPPARRHHATSRPRP